MGGGVHASGYSQHLYICRLVCLISVGIEATGQRTVGCTHSCVAIALLYNYNTGGVNNSFRAKNRTPERKPTDRISQPTDLVRPLCVHRCFRLSISRLDSFYSIHITRSIGGEKSSCWPAELFVWSKQSKKRLGGVAATVQYGRYQNTILL